MTRIVRSSLFLLCFFLLVMAFLFFLQLPIVQTIWPFEGTTPLTYLLMSSFLAAGAGAMLWVAVSQQYSALAGIGLDIIASLGPAAILTLQAGLSGRSLLFIFEALLLGTGLLFGLAILFWSLRLPLSRTPVMPRLVRISFVIFFLVLLSVAILLIMRVPNIIPWTITPKLSSMIGWMFLGSAAYFAYGLLRPSWVNSAGQLAAFLAYDVVLIIPLFNRLPSAAPEHRIGLILYVVVLTYSALLSVFFLFFHRRARAVISEAGS